MSSLRHQHSRSVSFAILLFALLFAQLATAQSTSGTISGTVVDPTGSMIPGATVTLINEKTGEARKVTSNASGEFSFLSLQPSTYTVKAERQGFATFQRKGAVLSASEHLTIGNLPLKTGNVTETVSVTSEGGGINTESSDLTSRLTADQISLIPVKGRDVTSMLRYLPGTSYDDDIESVGDGFGTNLPNFAGQRGRSAVASVDGLNGSEPSGSNKLSMSLNQDAIAEVKVLRNNYGAEYGNNGGAIVELITKSGEQQYHGSGYYYLRNEALNANSFLSNNTGVNRPLYRHNIWGVSLGGPVQIPKLFPNKAKNKMFFFYSYEKPHTITPLDLKFVTVPTALERAGDYSQSINSSNAKVFIADPLKAGTCSATVTTACFTDLSRATPSNPTGLNIIPAARINASGLAILNYFPLPNTSGRADGANYLVQKSQDVPKRSQVFRLDIKPLESDSFSIKTQQWTSDNEGLQTSGWPGGATDTGANSWGISSHYLYKDDGATLGWVHIFNPRMVNDMTIGIRHDTEGFIPSTGMVEGLSRTALHYTAPQIFPTNNELGTIPRATTWTSVIGRPANVNWLDRWGEVGSDHILPSVAENFAWSRGNHSLKFGAYYEHLINVEAPGGNWSGTFNFSNATNTGFTAAAGNTNFAYANALIGNFNTYTEDSGRPFTNLEIHMLQWYAQDEWKFNNRLTINYGLRLGYHTQLYQRDQLVSNFVPSLFNPAQAQKLYQPFCVGGTPAAAACAAANQRAQDPVTGALFANTRLVGTLVPGVGNPLDGLQLQSDPATPAGLKEVQPVDWEPRLGFAWDIFGSGKTVLHAMGGVYHSPRAGGGTTGGNLVSNAPFQRTLSITNGNIDNLVNLVPTALLNPTGLNGVEVKSKTATIYNFSLGFQQELAFKTILEVEYVGSLARHLGIKRNINAVPDGARFTDLNPQNRDPFQASTVAKADNFLRPYGGYGAININTYDATSSYHGLQTQLTRRYARGVQYGIAYTWSKTMDYAQDDDNGDVFYPRPLKQFNYGPANFDQTHIFTANYIWDLPSLSKHWNNGFVRAIFDNWQASGLTSLVSGKPKTITATYNTGTVTITAGSQCPVGSTLTSPTVCTAITDFTGGTVNALPNWTCNPNEGATGTTATGVPYLINRNCFVKPSTRGDIGSIGRNILRLPGLITTDVAVMKNIHTTEKTTLQFRWEVYNLFNHNNFRDIDASMTFNASGVQTNANFGAPTGSRPPRIMQGSLRFSF